MEVIHRVSFNKLDQADQQLEALGITYKRNDLPGGSYVIHFEINESDHNWLLVENLIKGKNGSDFAGIVFTKEEILNSEFSRILVTFEQGYPYPESKWQETKLEIFRDYCEGCGIYTNQESNFRIKKEFYTKNQFVSLMWSSAAIFCSPEVVDTFIENGFSGYYFKDIFIKNTEENSKYRQLITDNVITDNFLNKNVNYETCKKCGTKKYDYIHTDYVNYKRGSLKNSDFQKTQEWFGSGWNAFRQIIVTQKVAKIILDNNWKGIKLEPVLLQ